jgi:murein DD-endopeptidase MepM/ murein hydrolase activator NlpD
MTRKNRSYTFVVASHSGSRIWRTSVTLPVLVALGAAVLAVLIAGGEATHDYVRMRGLLADYHRMLSENDGFRTENQYYRVQTAQLGEKIDFLEATARELSVLSGMESEGELGGVGGFSRENLIKPLTPSSDTLGAIDKHHGRVSELEKRYRELKDFYSRRALLLAATPAFLPVRGYVTGGTGPREDPFNSSHIDYHTGVDISAPYGSRVIAPADGTVIFAGQRAGYGNIVVIDHKFGTMTRYGHLWKCNVETGQHVSRNDVIGYIGTTGRSTGPHLHFELWMHDRPVNPIAYFRSLNRKTG